MSIKKCWVKQYSQELGDSYMKIVRRMEKRYKFALAQMCGRDICFRCGNKIEKHEDLSIEHKVSHGVNTTSGEQEKLFFDLKNVAFSHIRCNLSAGGITAYIKRNKSHNKFVGIEKYTKNKYRIRFTHNGIKYTAASQISNLDEIAKIYDLITLKYHNGQGTLNFPDKKQEHLDMIKNGWKLDTIEKILSKSN